MGRRPGGRPRSWAEGRAVGRGAGQKAGWPAGQGAWQKAGRPAEELGRRPGGRPAVAAQHDQVDAKGIGEAVLSFFCLGVVRSYPSLLPH